MCPGAGRRADGRGVATSSVGENGEPVETYATLLVNLKYVPAPAQPEFANPESGGDSVFRCPEGINRRHVADDANTTPASAAGGHRPGPGQG
jgi:hypothetical protein